MSLFRSLKTHDTALMTIYLAKLSFILDVLIIFDTGTKYVSLNIYFLNPQIG